MFPLKKVQMKHYSLFYVPCFQIYHFNSKSLDALQPYLESSHLPWKYRAAALLCRAYSSQAGEIQADLKDPVGSFISITSPFAWLVHKGCGNRRSQKEHIYIYIYLGEGVGGPTKAENSQSYTMVHSLEATSFFLILYCLQEAWIVLFQNFFIINLFALLTAALFFVTYHGWTTFHLCCF